MTDRHPLRDVGVLVYHCPEAPPERAWIAFFTTRATPIYFPARTRAKAYLAAVHFRDRAVAKHQAAFAAKEEAARVAREKRKQRDKR